MKDTDFDLIRDIAERTPNYSPWCGRCWDVRMVKVEPFLWKCKCGAVHDSRSPSEKESKIGTSPKGAGHA